MAAGVTVYLADKWLGMLGGTAYTAPSAIYALQHVGDPGATGTANLSAYTTREQVTLAAASAGSIAITTPYPSWVETATETEQYISLWDASSGGNCLITGQLSVAQAEQSGYTFTLNVLTLSLNLAT